MTKETDRIDVTFDNNTGVPFYFSITNEEEIKQIMHIIFTGVLKKTIQRNKRRKPYFNQNNSR